MCESGFGRLAESTDDIRCTVHGAGLSLEDFNKPQVIENAHRDALTADSSRQIGIAPVWWEGNPCNNHLVSSRENLPGLTYG